jgi:hypothetical protein
MIKKTQQVGKYRKVTTNKGIRIYDSKGNQVKHSVFESYQKERLRKQRERRKTAKKPEYKGVRNKGRFLSKKVNNYLNQKYAGKETAYDDPTKILKGEELKKRIQEKFNKIYRDDKEKFERMVHRAQMYTSKGAHVVHRTAEALISDIDSAFSRGATMMWNGRKVSSDILKSLLSDTAIIEEENFRKRMRAEGKSEENGDFRFYWVKFDVESEPNFLNIVLPVHIYSDGGVVRGKIID